MFRSIIPVALRSVRVARPFQAVAVARVARPFSTTFVRLNEYSESAPAQPEAAASPKNNKLFVTNIPFTASEEELISILGATEVRIFRDQYGRSRGLATAEYESVEAAEEALQGFQANGLQISERNIFTRWHDENAPKRDRPQRSEGGYQGRREGGYRSEGGYQGRREGGYQGGRREGGYQGGRREGGYGRGRQELGEDF
ncbi:hypothetical protein YB2330_005636 [Saitoella coloradoensis]